MLNSFQNLPFLNQKSILHSALLILIFTFCVYTTFAQLATEPLRTDPTAVITKGSVEGTSILTDDFGKIFIEIPERTYIAHENDQTAFTGEIMPPKEITLPDQTPKTRMRAVFSFELVSDSGESLVFSDKINTLPARQRIRLESLNDGKPLEGAPKPKVIFVLENETVQQPKLWRFIDAEIGWQRVGGLTKELDETRRIFSVYINQTGKYSIIDEDPAPTGILEEAMREDYESLASIEEKIKGLEQIRQEILSRENKNLFSNENGYIPDFLDYSEAEIDSMSDEEFFDTFLKNESFPSFIEDLDSIDNFTDENIIIPSLDNPNDEIIPADLLDNDTPIPAVNSPVQAPTIITPIIENSDPSPLGETNLNQIPDNLAMPNTQPQTIPTQLPSTGEQKNPLQLIWNGFKTLFISLFLLGIPGYLGWNFFRKNE